jgi:hypothetical protein
VKARTIHHKARADEAVETLQVMKSKHIEVTVSEKLPVKIANTESPFLLERIERKSESIRK